MHTTERTDMNDEVKNVLLEDEGLLSGETESRVREAALAKVPGGTIERVDSGR
jgi:hypothetical protein